MKTDAMRPFGRALRDHADGQGEAQLLIRREDGYTVPLAVSFFFRGPDQLSTIEEAALRRCRGTVLDIGAGTGLHSLVLQAGGSAVTAVELDPDAVQIMRRRGVLHVYHSDVLLFQGGSFDTLLMLGHGIGMVETLEGLDRFLLHARTLTAPDGQLLIHSLDVRLTTDQVHLCYHEANRRAGRYIGETRIQFEYEGECGPFCGWLHVDAVTLTAHAERAGWYCRVLAQENTGDYLATLDKDSSWKTRATR